MIVSEKTSLWPQSADLSPWLDRSDALSAIESRRAAGEFDAETAQKLRQWHEEGCLVFPGLIEPAVLDHLLEAFEDSYQSGKELAVGSYLHPLKRDTNGHFGTVTGAFMELEEYRDILVHPKIMEWNRLLIGRDMFGAQSSFFFTGSEQPLHHDQVHETTSPYGMSVILAIAFEDIQPGSGPLIYYPGSHRLGYINAEQIAQKAGLESSQELIDRSMLSSMQNKGLHSTDWFKEYGIACNLPLGQLWAEKLAASGLKPRLFQAKKGDVLFFHTNLAHGGSPITDFTLSRKSMVSKYAAVDVGFYHEIAPDYNHEAPKLAYHNGYPYIIEEHLPLPDQDFLQGAKTFKDVEIARLKAELAAMKQWAEETTAQSRQALASMAGHLAHKEHEMLAAQTWINRKEVESAGVAAALTAALKSKEAELAVMYEAMKKQEAVYTAAIAVYETRQKAAEIAAVAHSTSYKQKALKWLQPGNYYDEKKSG